MRRIFLVLVTAGVLFASDALFDGARKGDVAAVRAALDSGVPVEAEYRYGQTALFIAASRGHAEVVKLLLERGAKAQVKDTFYGMTPLSAAAFKNSADVIEVLVTRGGVKAGNDMLIGAAGRGNTAVLAALLKQPGWSSKTMSEALASAEAGKHAAAAEALRKAGAQPPSESDVSAMERYRGRYQVLPGGREVFAVEPQGGLLVIKGESMTAIYRSTGKDTFVPADAEGRETVQFQVDADGKVTGAEMRQGQNVIRYKRLEEGSK